MPFLQDSLMQKAVSSPYMHRKSSSRSKYVHNVRIKSHQLPALLTEESVGSSSFHCLLLCIVPPFQLNSVKQLPLDISTSQALKQKSQHKSCRIHLSFWPPSTLGFEIFQGKVAVHEATALLYFLT